MISDLIAFTLSKFPLVCWIFAFCLAFAWRRGESFFESLTHYLLFLPVGLAGIWGFVMHVFFPDIASSYIGWKASPFEFEVGMANLGMGIMGVVGWRRSWDYALAATLMTSVFLWGAAAGHVREMVVHHDFAPGNAGAIFFTDIFIPLSLWVALWGWKRGH